jgi:hypothetical protein
MVGTLGNAGKRVAVVTAIALSFPVGGAAASWPLAARAQQARPIMGFLHEGLPAPLSQTVAFQQGLIEGGISGGSSVLAPSGAKRCSLLCRLPGG